MTDWLRLELASVDELAEDTPHGVSLRGKDLVVIRQGDEVHVLSGRCPHRGARLAERGRVEGALLVCGAHGWDFRCIDGKSPANEADHLARFAARVDRASGAIEIDGEAFARFAETDEDLFDPDALMI